MTSPRESDHGLTANQQYSSEGFGTGNECQRQQAAGELSSRISCTFTPS